MAKDVKALKKHVGSDGSPFYALGFVGALVYFLQHATGFTEGVIGVLKAIVWPAFLIYSLLDFLKL